VGGDGIFGSVWLQAAVPYGQLEIIVAFTRDNGQSLASKAMRTPLSLWLGELSMSIYLVHYLVIRYLCWAITGHSIAIPTETVQLLYCTYLDAL
jgi:peptidoglycan/LPS O-acetylase OafA/YrhL